MGETYTIKEVADILGFSTNSIYDFVKKKRIKGIRIGKGRYRISEEELKRVMHLSINTPSQIPSQSNQHPSDTTSVQTQNIQQQNSNVNSQKMIRFLRNKSEWQTERISLFDWFVVITSISLGVSLFLFNNFPVDSVAQKILPWSNAVRLILIAAGFGLLISQNIHRFSRFWGVAFRGTLILSYIFLALLSWQVSDGGGAAIGIIMAGAIGGSLLLSTGDDVMSFVLFIVVHSLVVPLVVFISPQLVQFPPNLQKISVSNPLLFGIGWMAIDIVNVLIIRHLFFNNRAKFYTYLRFYGLAMLIISFWFAYIQIWTEAVFYLALASTSFFTPVWNEVKEKVHDQNLSIRIREIFFVIVTVLFIGMLSVVFIIELNAKNQAITELVDKNSYAQIRIETIKRNIKDVIESSATNPVIIKFLEDKNYSSNTSESSYLLKYLVDDPDHFLRTVGIVDMSGRYHTSYPYDPIIKTRLFNNTQHYLNVIQNKKTYISNVFESPSSVKRPAVVIDAPVFNDKHEMIGMVVGSLDLTRINVSLQKIVSEQREQGLLLVDKNGLTIVNPDMTKIGSRVSNQKQELYLSADSTVKTVGNLLTDNQSIYQSYSRVSETNWIIAIEQPVEEILRTSNYVLMACYISITLAIFCTIAMILYIVRRIVPG